MIETSSSVRVGGPVYHAAAMVVAAIDAMAVLLSGQRHHFYAVGGGTTEAERQVIDMATTSQFGRTTSRNLFGMHREFGFLTRN
jgi:hypothetical protein